MQGSTRIDELRQKFHENPRRYFAPLANEYRKAGDPEQAIAICRAHLAQQPGHMSGHVVYAQSLYDAARVDESRVVFEKALSLDPDNAIVLRYLGDISRQRGDSAEALHWYSRALEADPHDSQVAAYIAELTEPLTESPATQATASDHSAADAAATAAPAEALAPAVEEKTESPEPRAAEQPSAEAAAEPSPETAEDASAEAGAAPSPEAAAEPATEAAEKFAPPHAEESTARDAEVEMPEPSKEPEVVSAAESPFVTRTMAELYASQGHREAALEVYRKLSAANPQDTEIADRIKALSQSEAPSPDSQPEAATGSHAEAATGSQAEAATESQAEAATESQAEVQAEAPAEAATETPAAATPETSAEHRDESPPAASSVPTMEPVELADFAPVESSAAAAEPLAANEFAELTDFDPDLTFHSELESETQVTEERVAPTGAHFTETEIEETHKWDEGVWTDDLSTGDLDITPYDFSPSELSAADESSAAPASSEPVAEPHESAEREAEPAAMAAEHSSASAAEDSPASAAEDSSASEESSASNEETQPASATAEQAPAMEEPDEPAGRTAEETLHESSDASADALEIAEYGAASLPLGVLNDAREEISHEDAVAAEMAPAETIAASSEETWPGQDHGEQHDEESLVAYSPQTPDEDELPHYEPHGPTIREFFATLGARRPPVNGAAPSFTAHAAVPGVTPIDDLPLASDAFSNLFADSAVSEEDTRAAFVLSGALAAQPQAPPPAQPRNTPSSSAPAVPATPAAPPSTPAAAQESEEDIRRFREWLDGLADA